MRRAAWLGIVVMLAAWVVPARGQESSMQATARKLYESLSADQKQKAVLPADSPERWSEVFTPGRRPGIAIKEFNDDQRKMAIDLITAFTSDYGRKKAEAVAAQDPQEPGWGRYYFLFFGRPGVDEQYAWRVAEHHLTIVEVEVKDGREKGFGPVLLGANPPTLWDDEEAAMIDLYGALSADERQRGKIKSPAISAVDMKESEGIAVRDLSEAARQKLKQVVEVRMRFYSDEIRPKIEKMLAEQGGIEAMRIGYTGPAEKKCADGGRWDFKLGGKGFLCDYESSRGHIHMSMKARGGSNE